MRRTKAFTLVELLVVIAIIALLLSILMPSLQKAKQIAQRVTCLASQKQLSLGWSMYADDNDDKIVYGGTIALNDPNFSLTSYDIALHAGEKPWVYQSAATDDYYLQKNHIEEGALWPYMKSLKIYKCPAGEKNMLRTYSLTDGLNSIAWMGGTNPALMVKRRSQLKNQSERGLFIDEGGGTKDFPSTMGWCIYYLVPWWQDLPPVRHYDGTTLSYVDGHAAFHRWQSQQTIDYTKANLARKVPAPSRVQPNNPDLRYMTIFVWGRLGWTPQ